MSCNPTKSLVRDASTLCCPPSKRYGGAAFRPVRAVPVDMFPHTAHCEMVVAFDRVDDPEAWKNVRGYRACDGREVNEEEEVEGSAPQAMEAANSLSTETS